MASRLAYPGGVLREIAVDIQSKFPELHQRSLEHWLAPRVGSVYNPGFHTVDGQHAAWMLLAIWLTGFASGELGENGSFDQALEWFGGGQQVPRIDIALDDDVLRRITEAMDVETCYALLPYLLDPLSLGTRRAVRRSELDREDRRIRRHAGVFYTPADLARFMVQHLPNAESLIPTSILDPAAGSGVFLRAAFSRYPDSWSRLYGIDIDPFAADFTSFVLLASQGNNKNSNSPWARWHQIRLNQVTADSVLIRGLSRRSDDNSTKQHLSLRSEAKSALANDARISRQLLRHPLEVVTDAFPELSIGVDIVVSNPPYAPFGPDRDGTQLCQHFKSSGRKSISATTNLYPFFIEQGINWLGNRGSLAMVTPLSVTFGSNSQMRELRRLLSASEAAVEFMSFDRTPDALFGDDVKTRNAIVFVNKTEHASVRTTGLLRWTSRTRSEFLQSVTTTPIRRDIGRLVPKVDSRDLYELYNTARQWPFKLEAWKRHGNRYQVDPSRVDGSLSIHVAPVAYNWLNVVVELERLYELGHTSSSRYQRIEFGSAIYRDAAYALASSRLAFFLWRVEGDGFHVTRRFIHELPIPREPRTVAKLASLGSELWETVTNRPLISVNGGKKSVALPPSRCSSVLAQIDSLLSDAFDLPSDVDLQEWYKDQVIVDILDERRKAQFDRKSIVSA